ncbi:hypothetical protein FHT86_001002 [Rhizobium sp. BK313]|nr:hypothetical protein [Rhizobium sp. BK313]
MEAMGSQLELEDLGLEYEIRFYTSGEDCPNRLDLTAGFRKEVEGRYLRLR